MPRRPSARAIGERRRIGTGGELGSQYRGRIVKLMGDGALRDFYPYPDPDRKSESVEVMNRLGCPPSLRF